MSKKKWVAAFICAGLILTAFSGSAKEGKTTLSPLNASFVISGQDVSIAGKIVYKNPEQFYFELKAPFGHYILAMGEKVYLYLPEKKRLFIGIPELISAREKSELSSPLKIKIDYLPGEELEIKISEGVTVKEVPREELIRVLKSIPKFLPRVLNGI